VNNQAQRVATAAVGIPLAAVVVWNGGLPLVLVVALIAWLGTRELFDLAERTGVRALRRVGMLLAALVPLVTWLVTTPLERSLNPVEGFVASVLAPLWLLVACAVLVTTGRELGRLPARPAQATRVARTPTS